MYSGFCLCNALFHSVTAKFLDTRSAAKDFNDMRSLAAVLDKRMTTVEFLKKAKAPRNFFDRKIAAAKFYEDLMMAKQMHFLISMS